MAVAWWKAGLFSRCPECGEGPLFEKILAIRPACPACGASFAGADTGDGAAVFVILVAGAIVVPVAVILLMVARLHPLAVMAVMLPVTAGVCIGLLRPFKATLFALQRLHKAGEGRLDGGGRP
jgi:uncharacterized protein (DUF983 family)